MTWMIGVDEAGYGPNLGPLCIGATAWARKKGQVHFPNQKNVSVPFIGDSKLLYKPGKGLAALELGVLGSLGAVPQSYSDLVEWTGADPGDRRSALPWYCNYDCPLPVDASQEQVETAADQLLQCSEDSGVCLEMVRARMVFPHEFNELVDRYGTKGAALSHVTIALVRELADAVQDSAGDEPIRIVCDKHGGRNRYGALLQHHFPESWIETVAESRAESCYRWDNVEIRFRVGGEEELPAALASMTAKYLRELCMRAFNRYWSREVPNLKPTAGYPVDARRFKADIETARRRLAIDDRVLWRNR